MTRRRILLAYREVIRSMVDVQSNLKIIVHFDGGQRSSSKPPRHVALFNLTSDPWEEQNLLESAEGRGDSWQTTAQLMSQAMAAEERELRRSSRAVAS